MGTATLDTLPTRQSWCPPQRLLLSGFQTPSCCSLDTAQGVLYLEYVRAYPQTSMCHEIAAESNATPEADLPFTRGTVAPSNVCASCACVSHDM